MMYKRMLSLALALLMALALCACGQKDDAPAATATPAPTAAPETAEPSPAPTPEPTSEPTPEPTPEPADDPAPSEAPAPFLPDAGLHPVEVKPTADPEIAARRELAITFLEKDVEDLIRELGEPLERSYAPSCLGDGQDGELVYEGFLVYTYREDGRETVIDVK